MRISLINVFICFVFIVNSQETVDYNSYINIVIDNHPLIIQAENAEKIGLLSLQNARGNFDPNVKSEFANKNYNSKTYYNNSYSSLNIPTWIGIDANVSYEWNNGYYTNPENTLPYNGLLSAGISVPVLKGLLFDKRRADIQKAKNYKNLGSVEKREIINSLIYEATCAYWDWYQSYLTLKIKGESINLAKETKNLTTKSYQLGSKPAIDTLEAKVQIQNRTIEYNEAELLYQNSKLIAASFL